MGPTNTLENQFIKDTFDGVLHTRGEPVSANVLTDVYDGVGNKTAISVSQNGATVTGVLSTGEFRSDSIYIKNQELLSVIYPVGSIILQLITKIRE